MCRDCRNAYHTAQRRKSNDTPERSVLRKANSLRERTRHQQVKVECIQYKGAKCVACGLLYDGTNSMVFDFHHVDPSTKSFEILKNSKKVFSTQKDELDKCVLLCANCHRKEHSDIF